MSKEGCRIEVFATQLRGRIAEGKRNAQEDFEALSRKLNIEILHRECERIDRKGRSNKLCKKVCEHIFLLRCLHFDALKFCSSLGFHYL